MGKLTTKQVEKAKPGMINDGDGLYLKVTGKGARSWIFRFKFDGRPRDMGLGAFPEIGLADAREKAGDARKLLRQGTDPIEARKAADDAPKGMTFDKAAAGYLETHKAGWRGARTAYRFKSAIARFASPVFGKKDVSAVTVDDVLRVLSPIWTTKHETATKLRTYIEGVLDWAKVKKLRTGENPAGWRGNLKHLLPKFTPIVEHHAALPWQDVPAFMADLRTRDALAARSLELTLLCATRTSETIQAERDEFADDLWVIPAHRHKEGKRTGKPHIVPLPQQAQDLLASMPVMDRRWMFPGHKQGRPLSNMAMLKLLERMGRRYDITVHGFRSTFRDWAAERTSFPREIAEMCLSHAVGNEVERAYRRSDMLEKRRALMQAWADHCFSHAKIADHETVIMPKHANRVAIEQ